MTFDTVVLIHAVNENSEFHAVCSRRIQDARDGPTAAFLTWNICYEFLRVTTHPNIMRPPLTSRAALRFITDLLNSPGFQILCPTSRHAEVLEQTLEELPWVRSNRFFDLHTAI